MKKIYLSILTTFIGFGLSAQFANSGFDQWSGNNLTGWTTNNDKASPGTVNYGGESVSSPVSKTTGQVGSAAKLTSFEVTGGQPTNNGLHGATIEQQIVNHTVKYDKIEFYLKYNTKNNDQAMLNITAIPASGWTPVLAITKYYSGNQSSWSKVSIPFSYSGNPSSLSFMLASSEKEINPTSGIGIAKGSWIAIDDIKLFKNGQGVGLNELIAQQTKIYPNPATNIINFEGDFLENGTLTIHSILGEEMLSTTLSNGMNSIDVSQFNQGVYLYSLMNAKGEIIKTDKFVINK